MNTVSLARAARAPIIKPGTVTPTRLRRLCASKESSTAERDALPHVPSITAHELDRLQAYDWPGNVRELQNLVERALILSRGGYLRFPELAKITPVLRPAKMGVAEGPVRTLGEAMADHIRHVLHRCEGRVGGRGGAAELLGMKPSTLRWRMKKLGIPSRRG